MTFTVLARDARLGLVGAATASRSLAVGASVISVDPGVGAVASQAWTNATLRELMLGAVRGGSTAQEAVAMLPEWDHEAEYRQVAALAWTDPGAARSGGSITAWSGDLVTEDAVFAGNLLTGGDVIDAMAEAWSSCEWTDPQSFAAGLIQALAAGDAAGGDARGRQSAAVLVATRSAVALDLRVDDHSSPIPELDRLRALAAGQASAVSTG